MVESLQAFDTALQSSYMSIKLVEQKINFFAKMCKILYKYGTPATQKFVGEMIVVRTPVLLSRFWDNLCVPLSRDDELLASEKDRIEATLAELATYADLVSLSI